MRNSCYANNIGNCVSTELIDIIKIPFGLISREYNNNIVSHAFRSFHIYFVMNVFLFAFASQQIFIDKKFTNKDHIND